MKIEARNMLTPIILNLFIQCACSYPKFKIKLWSNLGTSRSLVWHAALSPLTSSPFQHFAFIASVSYEVLRQSKEDMYTFPCTLRASILLYFYQYFI